MISVYLYNPGRTYFYSRAGGRPVQVRFRKFHCYLHIYIHQVISSSFFHFNMLAFSIPAQALTINNGYRVCAAVSLSKCRNIHPKTGY